MIIPRAVRLLVGLLAALVALTVAGRALAQTTTLDLASYERLLRAGQVAAARGDQISLELVAPQLADAVAVTLPDGATTPVNNAWLASELARPIPRLPWIAARLGALIDALAVRAPPAPADAVQRLEAILASPPFAQPAVAPREPSWLDRFFAWLGELLGRITLPVGEAAAGQPGSIASWGLTAAGAALVIGVLALWLRGLARTLRPIATLAPATAELRDVTDARAQAAALAHAGNYRAAVGLLARAALLWLDEADRLRYDAHQTNREHLARLREQPELRRQLAPIVETADRVWYGNAPLDAAAYAAYEAQVAQIEEQRSA